MIEKTLYLGKQNNPAVSKISSFLDEQFKAILLQEIQTGLKFDIQENSSRVDEQFDSLVWIQLASEKMYCRCRLYYRTDDAITIYKESTQREVQELSMAEAHLKEVMNLALGKAKKLLDQEQLLISQLSIPLIVAREIDFQFSQSYLFYQSHSVNIHSNSGQLLLIYDLEFIDDSGLDSMQSLMSRSESSEAHEEDDGEVDFL